MNNLAKLYLFLSYSDERFNYQVFSFYQEFKREEEFIEYKKRCEKSAYFVGDKCREIARSANIFSQEITTFEQYFIRVSQFYYLSSISFERYYINPLTIEGKKVSLDSLGDILIPFDNNLVSINEIIKIRGYNASYKEKAIDKAVDSFKIGALEYIKKPVDKIKKSKTDYMISTRIIILNAIQSVFGFLLNAFAVSLLFLPGLKVVWSETSSNSLSLFTMIILISMLIYDFIYIFYRMSYNRICEPYYYTKRFLSLKRRDLEKMVDKTALKLSNYLKDALKYRRTLRNDIMLCADLTENKIDLDSLEKVNVKLQSKYYATINNIKNIAFGILVILLSIYICFLIFYASMNGGIL